MILIMHKCFLYSGKTQIAMESSALSRNFTTKFNSEKNMRSVNPTKGHVGFSVILGKILRLPLVAVGVFKTVQNADT